MKTLYEHVSIEKINVDDLCEHTHYVCISYSEEGNEEIIVIKKAAIKYLCSEENIVSILLTHQPKELEIYGYLYKGDFYKRQDLGTAYWKDAKPLYSNHPTEVKTDAVDFARWMYINYEETATSWVECVSPYKEYTEIEELYTLYLESKSRG